MTSETYVTVEYRRGCEPTAVWTGSAIECSRVADTKRKEARKWDKEGICIDYSVENKEERDSFLSYRKALKEYEGTLTNEQKKETIEVDGRKYIKYMYEFRKAYENVERN